MIMKNSVKDELINKVYHLTNALNKAENLVNTLQQENENLKKLLEDMNIESEHHEYTLLGI
jgi:hypothetical protein